MAEATTFRVLLCITASTVLQASHPCDSNPCMNGGRCVRFSKNFACECPSSYTGEICDVPQPFQWSACSRTCGHGTRHRRCRQTENPKCQNKYEDCTVATCRDASCSTPYAHKYGSATQCCKPEKDHWCGVAQTSKASKNILGGTLSKVGEWPWQTAVWTKSPREYFCGGALLNEKWVITAAHCFQDNALVANDVIVKTGLVRLNGFNPYEQASDVDLYIKHDDYNEWNDDIALLKLSKPIRFSKYVKPICLPHTDPPDQDTICYVAGWGAGYHAFGMNETQSLAPCKRVKLYVKTAWIVD